MSTRRGVPRHWGANYSESSPSNEVSDSLNNSLPLEYAIKNVAPVGVREIAEKDAHMLAGLADAGFQTTLGPGDAGILYKTFVNFGGYYINKGTAQLIVDRKVPVRRDGIASFTPYGCDLRRRYRGCRRHRRVSNWVPEHAINCSGGFLDARVHRIYGRVERDHARNSRTRGNWPQIGASRAIESGVD